MRIFIKLLFVVILLGCVENTSKHLESDDPESKFDQLTELIDFYAEEKIADETANTYALAVYKNGEMYQNYYGSVNGGNIDQPTDSSLFEIASITKTFTGALVAKAVLNGKIDLEDDIRSYLNGDYPNLEFQETPIKVKNLLTHSLGLETKTPPRLEAFNEAMNSSQIPESIQMYSIDDLLEELKLVKLDKQPGTVYAYNSVGPELLAYILEQVNQQPFKKQVNEFLQELGMNNTYLQESRKHKDYLVQGYDGDEKAVMGYCPIYGAAGGAISTLPDMAIYMRYLIDNKSLPWIKEVSKILFTDPEDGENIGYLWQNIDVAEKEGFYYSKTGTSNGIQSGVLICPDSNYGIVLIMNNTSDEALEDWMELFFRDIEPDLINYPRLNLTSIIKTEFDQNPKDAITTFRSLKNDTINYYYNLGDLNAYGYQLLNSNKIEHSIELFKFLTEEFPEDFNTYDSLGEAYFVSRDYRNAIRNYKKSLDLNPKNDNAIEYIKKIEKLIEENNE